jgi:hypothetical protein
LGSCGEPEIQASKSYQTLQDRNQVYETFGPFSGTCEAVAIFCVRPSCCAIASPGSSVQLEKSGADFARGPPIEIKVRISMSGEESSVMGVIGELGASSEELGVAGGLDSVDEDSVSSSVSVLIVFIPRSTQAKSDGDGSCPVYNPEFEKENGKGGGTVSNTLDGAEFADIV